MEEDIQILEDASLDGGIQVLDGAARKRRRRAPPANANGLGEADADDIILVEDGKRGIDGVRASSGAGAGPSPAGAAARRKRRPAAAAAAAGRLEEEIEVIVDVEDKRSGRAEGGAGVRPDRARGPSPPPPPRTVRWGPIEVPLPPHWVPHPDGKRVHLAPVLDNSLTAMGAEEPSRITLLTSKALLESLPDMIGQPRPPAPARPAKLGQAAAAARAAGAATIGLAPAPAPAPAPAAPAPGQALQKHAPQSGGTPGKLSFRQAAIALAMDMPPEQHLTSAAHQLESVLRETYPGRATVIGNEAEEACRVLEPFLLTAQALGHKVQVVDLIRVQKESLWAKYQLRKAEMEEETGGKVNERQLYHGTSAAIARHIAGLEGHSGAGFDNRTSAAGLLGSGSYFAESASYSISFSTKFGHQKGQVHEMFLASVLLGKEGQGAPLLGNRPNAGCHSSCTAATPSPGSIWAVYDSAQAMPLYIIRFRID